MAYPEPLIHQRVQRLLGQVLSEGSGYHVNYNLLGMKTHAYIGIGLEKGSLYDSVCEELAKIPEVTECNLHSIV